MQDKSQKFSEMEHSKPIGSGSSYWEPSSVFGLTWQQSSAVQGLSWETFIKNKTWRSRLVEGLLCLLHMKLGALLQGGHPGPAGGSRQAEEMAAHDLSPLNSQYRGGSFTPRSSSVGNRHACEAHDPSNHGGTMCYCRKSPAFGTRGKCAPIPAQTQSDCVTLSWLQRQ